jgi:multidrug efflux pump subunit AcrB
VPGVVGTLVTAGDNDQGDDNVGRVYVRLVDPKVRAQTQEELKNLVRTEILPAQDPSLRLSINDVAAFGGAGASTARIQYYVSGPDLDTLEAIATKAVAELKQVPGAVDVDSSLVVGKPEIAVRVDRTRAAQLGVSVGDVANTLQLLVAGKKVSTWEQGGDQYEVRVRADRAWRGDPELLGLLPVPTPGGGSVALADLVELDPGTGPSSINRLSRQRVVTLVANAAPGVGENVVGDALVGILKKMDLPADYLVKPAGQTKLMKETGMSVLVGFGLAFVFMYLVLAAQFESWLHPFTILLSLPLTLPFAVLSIVLTGQALDMFSVLGIFVLFGIVKKNSILQIDHTNHLRAQGMERTEAILQANRDRLRPILMTTLAFVAGMIPLAMSKGVGAGFNRATSGVVVGGQTLSLLLTLLATPVAYTFFDDLLELAKGGLRRLGWMAPAPAAGHVDADLTLDDDKEIR